jgi:hypothetical protein
MSPRRWLVVVVAVTLAFATLTHAGHPLITEDTGTQGAGRFELEMGVESARDGDLRAIEFGPQLSYGLLSNLDLIVRPTFVENRIVGAGGSRERGLGDASIDGKWRFFDDDVVSFGTRGGLTVATGDADRGLGAGKTSLHGVLIAELTRDPWNLIANLGYASNPTSGERRNLWHVSAATICHVKEDLQLTGEVAADSNPDPTRATWPAVSRFGLIASVASWLDVDVGYQFRLNHAAPSQVILAGATVRW